MTFKKTLTLFSCAAAIASSALAQEAAPPAPAPAVDAASMKGGSQVNVPGNHWACYRFATPVAAKLEQLVIADQFGKAEIVIGQPVVLCNPSAKTHNGQNYGITNPQIHLMCYNIVKQLPNKNFSLKIGNQFHIMTGQSSVRNFFCAPTYKKHID